MATSRNRRITQARDIKARAKAITQEGVQRCAVFGCARMTARSTQRGLSDTYCKNHVEHMRRHGHPSRRSYRDWELGPYRKAARKWIKQHVDTPIMRFAVSQLTSLMSSAGRSKDAYHFRSAAPKEKARIVLAKLYEAGKTGEQLLEIVLIIKAAHLELGPRGYPDWEPVQIAKLAKRLRGASGTIQRDHEGRRLTEVYPNATPVWLRGFEKWPRAEGGFMRILGRAIAQRAAITPDIVEEVRELRRRH